MMNINVTCESLYKGNLPISVEEIAGVASKFLSFVLKNSYTSDFSDNYNYTFDLLFCDNDFIQNINREYRKIDAPTDVITFAMYSDSVDKIVVDNDINLGQIIISIDKAKTQAEENFVSVEYEILNLLSHGVLHLLGFDHPDEEQLEKMLEIQCKMIESVNYVKI